MYLLEQDLCLIKLLSFIIIKEECCGGRTKTSVQSKTDCFACSETKGTLSHKVAFFSPVRIISSQKDLSAVRMIQLSRLRVCGSRKHV